MHTYEGCAKVLASITSQDVAQFVDDKGIDMDEREFRAFCDYVADGLDGLLTYMGKTREWIGDYWEMYVEDTGRSEK